MSSGLMSICDIHQLLHLPIWQSASVKAQTHYLFRCLYLIIPVRLWSFDILLSFLPLRTIPRSFPSLPSRPHESRPIRIIIRIELNPFFSY